MLCSLFLIFCVSWPGAYAVDIPDLDDLGIDPWGDLVQLPDTVIQTPDPDLAGDLDGFIQDQIGGGEGSDFFSVESNNFSFSNLSSPLSTDYGIFDFGYKESTDRSNSLGRINFMPTSSYIPYSETSTRGYMLGSFLSSYMGAGYAKYVSLASSALPALVLRYDSVEYDSLKSSSFKVEGNVVASLDVYRTNEQLTSFTSVSSFHFVKPMYSFNGSIWFDFPSGSYTRSGNSTSFSAEINSSVSFSNLYIGFVYSGSISVTDQNYYAVFAKISNYSGVSVVPVVTEPEDPNTVTHGLLGTIIEWLKSLLNAILSLPENIATAVLDGLKSLFVPTAEEIAAIKENYYDLLSERLGFIWQAGEMVISFGQSVLSAFETATDFQFEFPGVSFELPELGQVTLIEPQAVSVNNAFMDVMQPILGTIVSFICVLAFINTAERMVVAVVSGVSYFHFLKGD